MEKENLQNIIQTLKEMNSISEAEQIMNAILELVNICGLLVEYKKTKNEINLKIQLIKSILDNLYKISLKNYESIENIIDTLQSQDKLTPSIQGSTIGIKQTETFTMVQKKNGKNILKFESGDKEFFANSGGSYIYIKNSITNFDDLYVRNIDTLTAKYWNYHAKCDYS